jgi:hypothetical protein
MRIRMMILGIIVMFKTKNLQIVLYIYIYIYIIFFLNLIKKNSFVKTSKFMS